MDFHLHGCCQHDVERARRPALVMTCRCGERMLLRRTTDGERVRETWYCARRRVWNFWKHAQLVFYVAVPGKDA